MASSSSSAIFTEPNPDASENPGRGLGQKRKHGERSDRGRVEERKRNCRETDEDLEEIGGGSEVGKPGEGAGRISRQCLRIQNVPREWSQDDLLDYLRNLDTSLGNLDASALSLYPACAGPTQTALLNPEEPLAYFMPLRTKPSMYLPVMSERPGRKVCHLEIDSHFSALTPLNAPEGEIVAESVSHFSF